MLQKKILNEPFLQKYILIGERGSLGRNSINTSDQFLRVLRSFNFFSAKKQSCFALIVKCKCT